MNEAASALLRRRTAGKPGTFPVIAALIFAFLPAGGCFQEHFGKAPDGFRTVGLGMTRAQVWERLQADSAFRLSGRSSGPRRLSASTAIGNYQADLRFEFNSRGRLSTIRISVGEAGRLFVDDQAVPYFYNCLRTRFGPPRTALDTYNHLELYTWDSPAARRTLAAIRYWIPTGKFLLVFISDPREPSAEETEVRKYEATGRGFGEAEKFPTQKAASSDF